jgi:hypothetical protein
MVFYLKIDVMMIKNKLYEKYFLAEYTIKIGPQKIHGV